MQATLALHTLIHLHSPVIVCLHSVGPGVDAMPSDTFQLLLDGLLRRGYRFLTTDEILGPRVLRWRTVLLTFDDGRQDNFDIVLPILREFGIAGTFYVCPGLVGKRKTFAPHPDCEDKMPIGFTFDMMDWDALRELRDCGMCIGCHSDSHSDLTRCPDGDLDREIIGSKRMLEDKLAIRVRHFSFPWGRFDPRVLKKVRAAGYQTAAAVSVNPLLPVRPWDAFTLPRVTAHPASGHQELLRLIAFPNMVRRTLGQARRAVLAASPFAGRSVRKEAA